MKKKSEKELAREWLMDFLEKKSLRKTPERFLILDKIYTRKCHFDVETLFAELQEGRTAVSRATLYNALELFQDCGLVARVQLGDVVRYEPILKEKFHHYLVCTDCRKVSLVSNPTLKQLIENRKIPRFTPSCYVLSVYGRCARCAKKSALLQKEQKQMLANE